MKKNKILYNTSYCIKYIWKIDSKYILLMIIISVLTSIFNVVNLSILRYITDTLMEQKIKCFLVVILVMFLLSITIAVINGSASYLYEPLLQNRIIETIQKDIYKKAKSFNLEDYENKKFYELYYFVVENGKTGIINSVTLTMNVSLNADNDVNPRACMCRDGFALSSALGDNDNCSHCGCNCWPWNHGANASTANGTDWASV